VLVKRNFLLVHSGLFKEEISVFQGARATLIMKQMKLDCGRHLWKMMVETHQKTHGHAREEIRTDARLARLFF